MKRALRAVLIVLGGLLMGGLSLGSCIVGMLAFNAFNPMQTGFITQVRVVNGSDETLLVTPRGETEGGRTVSLPRYYRAFPAIPHLQRTDIAVGPGDTLTLYYDWDDVQFRFIEAKRPGGERDTTWLLYVRECCSPPFEEVVVVGEQLTSPSRP